MSKGIVIKIIIGIIVAGTITTGTIVTTKIISDKHNQEEMKQDLDAIEITLKKDKIDLPYKREFDKDLYNGEYDDLYNTQTNTIAYNDFVESYQGGELSVDAPNSINIEQLGEQKVICTVTSEKGNTKTKELIINVKDMKSPEISVKDNTINIEKSTEVNVLQGVTANDNVDGDITSKITTEGTVDTNKEGEYTIIYKVTDTVGLTAEKTRTYKVKEKPKVEIGRTYRYRNVYTQNGLTFGDDWSIKLIDSKKAMANFITYSSGCRRRRIWHIYN